MHTEGSEAEFEIGELLKSHLTRYRGGSVVINHLELLPPSSPRFCSIHSVTTKIRRIHSFSSLI